MSISRMKGSAEGGRRRKSAEEGAMAREIDANLGCRAARGKKGMNNEGNKREKGKERERRRETPVKYVVTKGTRNSPASGNRNKSKEG